MAGIENLLEDAQMRWVKQNSAARSIHMYLT